MGVGKGLLRSPHEVPNLKRRGGVPVPDGKGLLFPSGWRCGGGAEVGWGCAGEGHSPLHSPLPKLDSPIRTVENKYLPARQLIKRDSLGRFYQECCLGRGSAWSGVSQPAPSTPAAPRAPSQALRNRWDVATAQSSTESSALIFS